MPLFLLDQDLEALDVLIDEIPHKFAKSIIRFFGSIHQARAAEMEKAKQEQEAKVVSLNLEPPNEEPKSELPEVVQQS